MGPAGPGPWKIIWNLTSPNSTSCAKVLDLLLHFLDPCHLPRVFEYETSSGPRNQSTDSET